MVVTLVILIALVSIAALIATWMIGKKYEEQEQERLRENNATIVILAGIILYLT